MLTIPICSIINNIRVVYDVSQVNTHPSSTVGMDEEYTILTHQTPNIRPNSSTTPHIYDEITYKYCGNVEDKENTVGT